MAQVATGFPWQGQPQEPDSLLSEKPVNGIQNETSDKARPSDNTAPSVHYQIPRVPTIEKQKQNRKSRARAVSLKASAPVIHQNREELDQYLAYGATRRYNVRTIPAWVQDAVEDDIVDDNEHDFPDSPNAALVAQHNASPSTTFRAGRQERHTTSSGAVRQEKTSRWISFARASAYPRENFHGEKVDTDWLNENFTDYSKPWLADHEDDLENDTGIYRAFKRKRATWSKRMQYTILRNPFVPLAFRFTVIVFAAAAIGLGGSIYHESGIIEQCTNIPAANRDPGCLDTVGDQEIDYYRDPSGLMAMIIDVIAIVYSMYITYDEYFSKPLGLRKARAKVRLVLLDLFFIVFQSANLSLAFEALTVSQGACYVGSEPSTSYRFDRICDRAEALAAVLLISLFAWLLTFSVSVLRLVERIDAR